MRFDGLNGPESSGVPPTPPPAALDGLNDYILALDSIQIYIRGTVEGKKKVRLEKRKRRQTVVSLEEREKGIKGQQ
jgi:hypothetical protein